MQEKVVPVNQLFPTYLLLTSISRTFWEYFYHIYPNARWP